MRVASFNIRNGRAFDGRHSWPLRRWATLAAVEALDADVIGLQEAFGFQLRWLARRLPGYEVHGDVGRDDGRRGERCPVLVRRGATTVSGCRTRWYGETPDRPGTRMGGAHFPRLATLCRVTGPGPEDPVQLVNTHLDSAVAANRDRSVAQLLGWLDLAEPCVVLGDLNAPPGAPPLRRLEEAGLRSALAADAAGTAHNFTGRLDGPRIDHVLVSSHWDVVAAEVVADRAGCLLPSDHWPVRADLRLAGAEQGAG
jgi:endonuclease/exonuclease/phosphatase family metal-dependent hydrolase